MAAGCGSAPSVWRRGGSAGRSLRAAGQGVLSHEELALLLGGIDLAQTRRRRWYRTLSQGEQTPGISYTDKTLVSCRTVSILMTYSRERHIFQIPIRSRANHSARKGTGLAHLKIQVLEERLRLQRIQKYGSRQRKAQRCAAQPAGTRTWSEQRQVQAESVRDRCRHRRTGSPVPHPGRAGSCPPSCRAWSA